MLQILIQYHNLFIQGFLVTLQILVISILIGLLAGTVLGILAAKYSKDLSQILKYAKFIVKVIPFIVLLFWLHYPLQSILGIVVDPLLTGIFALSLVNTILTANLICGELELLPQVYIDAGITLGMSKMQIIQYIELPLLLRRILPSLLLNQASILEMSLFASLISVPEIFRTAQSINSMIYKPVEIYTLLILFFFIILGPLHLLVNKLEKKYSINYA